MRLAALLGLLSAALFAQLLHVAEAEAWERWTRRANSGPVEVWRRPAGWGGGQIQYGRHLHLGLPKGAILATWEWPGREPQAFPIYLSSDNGRTWGFHSKVESTQPGREARFEPFLYQLRRGRGSMPAGTILLVGNFAPASHASSHLDIYMLHWQTKTWTYVSTVAQGGRTEAVNGQTPVWEPFLMETDGEIICYYSDQRNGKGQTLVLQTSRDLVNWSGVRTIFTGDVPSSRPGMPVVTYLGGSRYMLVFEYWSPTNGRGGGKDFNIWAMVANDPVSGWNQASAFPVVATDGSRPRSSPYVVNAAGMVAVSCGDSGDVWVGNAAQPSARYHRRRTGLPSGYSRSLAIGTSRREITLLTASPASGTVTFATLDIP